MQSPRHTRGRSSAVTGLPRASSTSPYRHRNYSTVAQELNPLHRLPDTPRNPLTALIASAVVSSSPFRLPIAKVTAPSSVSSLSGTPRMSSNLEEKSMAAKPSTKEAATQQAPVRAVKEFKSGELSGIAMGYIDGDKIDGHALDAKLAALLNELGDVNGQDAYSTTDAVLGKLNKSEYLLLPLGFEVPIVDAKDVGTPEAAARFGLDFLAQVYALNKDVVADDKTRFGLARMEAVKMGWFDARIQKEYRYVKQAPNALKTFVDDLADKKNEFTLAQKVAWLTPLAAEYVFRTLGHHYVDATAATYRERYKRIFDSSLEPACATYLAGATQFHKAFHWITPQRVRNVLNAQLTSGTIPDAVALRKNAAPAGTAIITTTAAVLESAKASGYYEVLKTESKCDLDLIVRTSADIKSNPPKFHRVPQAYGLVPLPPDEAKALEAVKQEAIKFAPIAQAYVDALLGKAALGKALALKKHALENPVLYNKLLRVFRQLSRAECKSISDAFRTSVELTPKAPGGPVATVVTR